MVDYKHIFSDCLSEYRGFVVDLPLLYAQHVMHSSGDTYLSYEASLPILLSKPEITHMGCRTQNGPYMEELETYKLKSPEKRLSARLYSKAVVHLPQGVQYTHSQL